MKEAPGILRKLLHERTKVNNNLQQEENPENLKSIQNTLNELDIQIEEIRTRQQSNIAIANLVTAMLNAGKTEEAKVLLESEAKDSIVLKILEVRKGKSAGTVRKS